MREQQIQGYISGIRDEFILEAQPKALAALVLPEEHEAGKILPPVGQTPPPRRRSRKRWIPLVVAAAIAVTVGLNIGLYSGLSAIVGPGGLFPSGAPSHPSYPTAPGGSPWGDLFGSLFPFLSPDETESEPGDATEEPDATVTKNPCADGHDYEPQLEREASCYAVSIHRLVCRDCGRSKKERGEEILPHVYEDGYCTGCGLVEGAHPIESCTFQYTKNVGYSYENGSGTPVQGFILTRIEGDMGETLILPNVYFTEQYGLLPVVSVDTNSLNGRDEFSKVVLPNKALTLGYQHALFANCTSLTEIVWPECLRNAGNNTFRGCTALKEITIPDTVKNISGWLLAGCTSLESATILKAPDNGLMGQSVFEGCTSLTEVHLPDDMEELPATTFVDCTSLRSIELPPRLKFIEFQAFLRCSNLEEIHIPSSVGTIGFSAFEDCTSLRSVELPRGLTKLEESVFAGCTSLESVSLSDRMTHIEREAFLGCTSLAHIELPASLQTLEARAFNSCTSLTEITLPASLQTLGGNAFTDCTSLEQVTILGSISKDMGDSLFSACPSLRTVYLPEGLTTVTSHMFDGCTSLSEISLPAGLKYIGMYAFSGCSSLTDLDIPDTVDHIDTHAFTECTSLRRVSLPASLMRLKTGTFLYCTALTELTLPDGFAAIEGDALRHTGLVTLTIPGTVTYMETNAIGNNPDLAEIRFLGTVEEWQTLTGRMASLGVPVYCDNGKLLPNGTVEPNS